VPFERVQQERTALSLWLRYESTSEFAAPFALDAGVVANAQANRASAPHAKHIILFTVFVIFIMSVYSLYT
jgi:hypothetical protein